MISTKKLLMIAALALVALTAAASSASAAVTGVIVRPASGSIEQVSLGLVSFVAGEITIECRLSLRGTLTAALVAISATIGEVTNVTWAECRGGEVEGTLAKPWPITVSALNGAAPSTVNAERLTEGSLKITRTEFELSTFGRFIHCLYGTATESTEGRAPLTRTGGTKEYRMGLMTVNTNSLAKVSGSLCPSTGRLAGTFEAVRPAQTITFL